MCWGGSVSRGGRRCEGHSDADVVAHALADAMLGAAALGDLGTHFPDSDERWAGADSLAILAQVAALVGGRRTAACERRLHRHLRDAAHRAGA